MSEKKPRKPRTPRVKSAIELAVEADADKDKALVKAKLAIAKLVAKLDTPTAAKALTSVLSALPLGDIPRPASDVPESD